MSSTRNMKTAKALMVSKGPMSEQDERMGENPYLEWSCDEDGDFIVSLRGVPNWHLTMHSENNQLEALANLAEVIHGSYYDDKPTYTELARRVAELEGERDAKAELLARAAMEINCAGPVHERIQVLRRTLTQIGEREQARAKAAEARVQALTEALAREQAEHEGTAQQCADHQRGENAALNEIARLREALKAVRHPLQVAASYSHAPEVTMGLQLFGRDCAKVLARVDAALAAPRREKE